MRTPVRIFVFLANFLCFFSLLQISTVKVYAGAFQVTRIGSLETNGALFDKWYYTDNKPTFTGIGLTEEVVNIVLDGTSFSTTVNTENQWSFTPASFMNDGEHYISFASAGSSLGFKLFIGKEIPEGVKAPPPAETPVAGAFIPTLVFSSIGTLLVSSSLVFYKRRS